MITNSFKYRDLDITHISKPNLKNSYISINNEAEVILKTPKVSKRFIFELLDEKEAWIRKKLSQQIQNPPIKVNLEDEVLLFGELCSIDTYEATELRIKLENIRISSTANILKCYNSFYKNYSVKYITPRVEYYSKIMDLKYKEIKFRKMKGRWGSCSSKKVLTFNTELIKIKKELIDYVVVHELAHLKYMNHSRHFHNLVNDYLPNSKEHRKELKDTKISIF